MPDKSLIWFRKNLRVFDNKCLSKALTESQEVIAIYVIDERLFEMTPYGFKRASEFRLKFLYESLINLKNNLAMMNLDLIILEGNSFQQISKIMNGLKITDVYYEKDKQTGKDLIVYDNSNDEYVRNKPYKICKLLDNMQIPYIGTYNMNIPLSR